MNDQHAASAPIDQTAPNTAAPTAYLALQSSLRQTPQTWLVTGVAGFIGSHLLETLLGLGQRVVGLDNFATGHQHNLDQVRSLVGDAAWAGFNFIEGDIRQLADCQRACQGVDRVLHQAALGSVPRSLADPITTNAANVTGFLNLLWQRETQAPNASYTRPAAAPMATIPACPRWKTASASRCHPMR